MMENEKSFEECLGERTQFEDSLPHPLRGARRRTRMGLSLVEIILVIGLVGIIGTATIRMFHVMMMQQRATSVDLSMAVTESRFRLRFAKDVKAATDAEVAPDKIELQLPDDRKVVWEQVDDSLKRTIVDSQGTRDDHFFEVMRARGVRFDRLSNEGGELLIALLEPREVAQENRYVSRNTATRVAAELSRDHRWTTSQGEGDE